MKKIKAILSVLGKLNYYITRSWRKIPTSRVINEYCPDETPDTITDDFCSISAWCPDCGQKTMQVVRPGSYQCSNCG